MFSIKKEENLLISNIPQSYISHTIFTHNEQIHFSFTGWRFFSFKPQIKYSKLTNVNCIRSSIRRFYCTMAKNGILLKMCFFSASFNFMFFLVSVFPMLGVWLLCRRANLIQFHRQFFPLSSIRYIWSFVDEIDSSSFTIKYKSKQCIFV